MAPPRNILDVAKETKALAEKAIDAGVMGKMDDYANFVNAATTSAPLLADAVIECVKCLQNYDYNSSMSNPARELLTKLGISGAK